jgi:hypothetical protein
VQVEPPHLDFPRSRYDFSKFSTTFHFLEKENKTKNRNRPKLKRPALLPPFRPTKQPSQAHWGNPRRQAGPARHTHTGRGGALVSKSSPSAAPSVEPSAPTASSSSPAPRHTLSPNSTILDRAWQWHWRTTASGSHRRRRKRPPHGELSSHIASTHPKQHGTSIQGHGEARHWSGYGEPWVRRGSVDGDGSGIRTAAVPCFYWLKWAAHEHAGVVEGLRARWSGLRRSDADTMHGEALGNNLSRTERGREGGWRMRASGDHRGIVVTSCLRTECVATTWVQILNSNWNWNADSVNTDWQANFEAPKLTNQLELIKVVRRFWLELHEILLQLYYHMS